MYVEKKENNENYAVTEANYSCYLIFLKDWTEHNWSEVKWTFMSQQRMQIKLKVFFFFKNKIIKHIKIHKSKN